jgi:hypothetical protein
MNYFRIRQTFNFSNLADRGSHSSSCCRNDQGISFFGFANLSQSKVSRISEIQSKEIQIRIISPLNIFTRNIQLASLPWHSNHSQSVRVGKSFQFRHSMNRVVCPNSLWNWLVNGKVSPTKASNDLTSLWKLRTPAFDHSVDKKVFVCIECQREFILLIKYVYRRLCYLATCPPIITSPGLLRNLM